ncbi:IS4/IS5 family transposase, partial [Holdemanella sp. L34]|nr:IS4/IS5 family transposase [Holdemanella hominis]
IKTMNDSSSLFVVDSNKDFTRKRKHLFGSTLFNVLLLESGSLKDEMFKLFGYKLDTPTASSFVQARSKIRPDAFRTLFNMFNERTQKIKLHKGYRLLAVDGSVLPISSVIKDTKTTFYKANNSNKPFSAYHLNTSYDLLECTYDDIVLQGNAVMNENGAFNEIVDRYDGPKAIF